MTTIQSHQYVLTLGDQRYRKNKFVQDPITMGGWGVNKQGSSENDGRSVIYDVKSFITAATPTDVTLTAIILLEFTWIHEFAWIYLIFT